MIERMAQWLYRTNVADVIKAATGKEVWGDMTPSALKLDTFIIK